MGGKNYFWDRALELGAIGVHSVDLKSELDL